MDLRHRPRVLLVSHDGYGLGHVRRNARLAAALHRQAPGAEVTIVTGVSSSLRWLEDGRTRIERIPGLTKGHGGERTSASSGGLAGSGSDRPATDPGSDRPVTVLGTAQARHTELRRVLAQRARGFATVVESFRPDVVVVDRHPFGVEGEWRRGLDLARRGGAAVVLGLRDVLDDPAQVRRELAGPDWEGAATVLDQVLVYGTPGLCDHEKEYGLALPLTYCGVVVDRPPRSRSRRDLLLVCSGGGADGQAVGRLGAHVAPGAGYRETLLVLGPAAGLIGPVPSHPRLRVVASVPDCGRLYGRAAACLQMAGYNSTYEALAAGLRPILVPRVQPRREQVIRASRLANLGLADVLDADATVSDVEWMLRQERRLAPGALRRAGILTNGADVAVRHTLSLLGIEAAGVEATGVEASGVEAFGFGTVRVGTAGVEADGVEAVGVA